MMDNIYWMFHSEYLRRDSQLSARVANVEIYSDGSLWEKAEYEYVASEKDSMQTVSKAIADLICCFLGASYEFPEISVNLHMQTRSAIPDPNGVKAQNEHPDLPKCDTLISSSKSCLQHSEGRSAYYSRVSVAFTKNGKGFDEATHAYSANDACSAAEPAAEILKSYIRASAEEGFVGVLSAHVVLPEPTRNPAGDQNS